MRPPPPDSGRLCFGSVWFSSIQFNSVQFSSVRFVRFGLAVWRLKARARALLCTAVVAAVDSRACRNRLRARRLHLAGSVQCLCWPTARSCSIATHKCAAAAAARAKVSEFGRRSGRSRAMRPDRLQVRRPVLKGAKGPRARPDALAWRPSEFRA